MNARNKICNCVLVFAHLILILQAVPCTGYDRLRLIDNGYKGLVVAISNVVPEEHCSQVILGLKGVLQEFSRVLSSFTGGRMRLRDVTIILPSGWRSEALPCQPLGPLTRAAIVPDVHIRIDHQHPRFGAQPWTRQTQGCRKQGDHISMSADYLMSNNPSASAHLAEMLTEEWVKFRWGTFEESGFNGDPLYPEAYHDPHTNRVRANTCVKQHAEFTPVCPKDYHVPEAPTKQNAQCRGISALDVILQSKDFSKTRHRSNSSLFAPPVISYMTISPPLLVLLVEDTAAMNIQQRWEYMRKAVRHVMVYDIPDDVHVGVVIFNSKARETAPLVKIDSYTDIRQRIGASLPRNPSTVPESQKCILCGVQESIQVLKNSVYGSIGGKIILVTTGNGFISPNEVSEIENLALLSKTQIDIVFYPLTEHRNFITDASSLKSVVAETGGSSYSVMDEGVGKDSKVGMMVALMNALFYTMRYKSTLTTSPEAILLHKESYPGGRTSLAEGSFIIDDSFGPSFRFSVFYYDLSHVGNTVQLKSPTGEKIDTINMKEDGDANIIYVNVLEAERGYWHYQVENRADSHQALHIQVTALEGRTRRINFDVWKNSHSNIINMTDTSKPVIIYAELGEGSAPILNAKVTATLRRLGTNVSGSNFNQLNFDLLDNGNGDPDITGDDGVYSRYLPSVYGNPGYYQLTVTADYNDGHARSPSQSEFPRSNYRNFNNDRVKCCGSFIKYDKRRRVVSFQRSLNFGVLDIISLSSGMDILPPNRILDLHSDFNRSTFEMNLQWTAPGDDYDNGRAAQYEGVLAKSWEKANDFSGELIMNMPLPKYAGREQNMLLKIEHYNKVIYIAIRAVDESKNSGVMSNIISQWIPPAPTLPPEIIQPMTLQPSTNKAQPLGSDVTVHQKVEAISIELIAIIIGSAVGCLFIVFAFATLYYCHVTRHRELQKREEDKTESKHNGSDDSIPARDTSNSNQSLTETAPEEIEQQKQQPLSPTTPCRASNSLPMHPCQMLLPGSPAVEIVEPQSCFQICPDPYPDIVHMSNSSYQIAQVSPSIHSDLTPHQSPYTTETTFNYASPSHFQYPNPSSPYSPCMMSTFIPENPSTLSPNVTEFVYQTDLTCPVQIPCTSTNSFCTPVQSPLYGQQNNMAVINHQANAYYQPSPLLNNPNILNNPHINNIQQNQGNTICHPVSPLNYGPYQTQPSCSHDGAPVCSVAQPLTYPSSISNTNPTIEQGNTISNADQTVKYEPCESEVTAIDLSSVYTRISPPAPFKPSFEECVTSVSSNVAYSDKKSTEITHL